jgi:hypothetical protein
MGSWSSEQIEEVGGCTTCEANTACPCGAKVKCARPVNITPQYYTYSCGACSILRISGASLTQEGQYDIYDWLDDQQAVRDRKAGAGNQTFEFDPNHPTRGVLGEWDLTYYLVNKLSKKVSTTWLGSGSRVTLTNHLEAGGTVIAGTEKHWISLTGVEDATNSEGETETRVRLNESWSGVAMWIPIANILPGRAMHWADCCMNPSSKYPDEEVREEFNSVLMTKEEGGRGPYLTSLGRVIGKILLVSDAPPAAGGGGASDEPEAT